MFGRPGVIRTLDLTRIRRALCRLSYWSLVIRTRVDSLRSPFGRTMCVCRRFAPRRNSHFEVESLAACPLADRITVWRDAWGLNPHLLDRQSSALAIKLPSLRVVEDRGFKPRSSPCKSDVLPNELIPRCLAGTAGFAPASFRVTTGHSAIELHAIGALGWLCTIAAPGFNRPLY